MERLIVLGINHKDKKNRHTLVIFSVIILLLLVLLWLTYNLDVYCELKQRQSIGGKWGASQVVLGVKCLPTNAGDTESERSLWPGPSFPISLRKEDQRQGAFMWMDNSIIGDLAQWLGYLSHAPSCCSRRWLDHVVILQTITLVPHHPQRPASISFSGLRQWWIHWDGSCLTSTQTRESISLHRRCEDGYVVRGHTIRELPAWVMQWPVEGLALGLSW